MNIIHTVVSSHNIVVLNCQNYVMLHPQQGFLCV